jgi:microcompartment protein CcmL/EutN
MPRPALGLIETSGLDGAIKATRAASASGQVVIVSAEQGIDGRMTVKIEGDWSAVQSAVEAGARAAYQAQELVSMHVIPKPDQEVDSILPYSRFVNRFTPEDKPRSMESKPRPPAQRKTVSSVPSRTRPEKITPPVSVLPAPPIPPPVAAPQVDAQVVSSAGSDAPVHASPAPSWEQLDQMAVVVLRRYARTIPELPIKGREISKANKQQLLEAIRSVRTTSS